LVIEAVSLDFWHTLYMERPGAFRLYAARRHQLLRQATKECGPFTDEQISSACRAEAEAHHRIWRDQQRTLSASQRIATILDRLGARLAPEKIAQLAIAYEEGILEQPPVLVDGARDALEKLSARYKLGIICDVGFSPGRVLRRVLADSGILEAFDSLVFSDEAGRSKPHPQVFQQTAIRLGAEPHRIVHVGDLEHTDIAGAKAAGYRSIRFAGVTPIEDGETTAADGLTREWRDVPLMLERF
jgi:HAD superfamily hydrolase (TIGR01549 family)